jgi:transposase
MSDHGEHGKKPRCRRSSSPELQAGIVQLCQQGDRSVGQVAKDFDLTEIAVREWVKQAKRDAGTRQDGGLTSSERAKRAELRRENRRLRQDVDTLKWATAFFAKPLPSEDDRAGEAEECQLVPHPDVTLAKFPIAAPEPTVPRARQDESAT